MPQIRGLDRLRKSGIRRKDGISDQLEGTTWICLYSTCRMMSGDVLLGLVLTMWLLLADTTMLAMSNS